MAGPSVTVRVLGDLKGLGQSLGDAGSKAEGVASRGAAAFKSFLGGINATGALGPMGGLLDGISSGIDNLVNHAKGVGPAMIGAGAAVTGLGAGLSAFGSKEQASHQQLQAAIEATGGSYEDYGAAIDGAIKHQEKYGHTSDETQNALQKLTQATHDPQKALDLLGEASDIAAAKHEDLTTASTQLGKVYNGNTKLLKEYGISIDKNTGLTKDGKTATQALADVTKGQAAAASDTFAGKLDNVKAKIEDSVAQLGQKYGPALQGIGVATTLLGSIWSVVGPAMATEEGISLGPILLVALAIAGLIAIGYVLYRNWDTIWSGIQAAIGAVWDWIKGNWPLLLGILLGPIALAAALIYQYWDQVKAAAFAVIAFIESIWNSLVSFFEGIPGRVAGFFTAIWEGIKSGVSSAIGWVTQQFDNLVATITGLPGRIADAASGMFHGISDAFKAAINWVINGWNSLDFTMPEVDTHIPGVGKIGGWKLGTPHITPLAAGGIVTSPTLALLGERGTEVVRPLSDMGPTVNVEHAHFGSEVDIDLFMRRAAWVAQTSTT
jgi:hypothetical protein